MSVKFCCASVTLSLMRPSQKKCSKESLEVTSLPSTPWSTRYTYFPLFSLRGIFTPFWPMACKGSPHRLRKGSTMSSNLRVPKEYWVLYFDSCGNSILYFSTTRVIYVHFREIIPLQVTVEDGYLISVMDRELVGEIIPWMLFFCSTFAHFLEKQLRK